MVTFVVCIYCKTFVENFQTKCCSVESKSLEAYLPRSWLQSLSLPFAFEIDFTKWLLVDSHHVLLKVYTKHRGCSSAGSMVTASNFRPD